MTTSTVIWIIVAVVVGLLLIAAVIAVATRSRTKRRVREAQTIRERAREETTRVERREALGGETAAKARAAQAEAEAKAAEAARLQERAATHQSGAAASREELEKQFAHADRIDPSVGAKSAEAKEDRPEDQEPAARHQQHVRSAEETT
jgi:FtsZ-interacting cell division protein ZipA